MRFRTSEHGGMFFLPRPTQDTRLEDERQRHWDEVLAWCTAQWGPAQLGTHDRDYTTWKYFGLYAGGYPDDSFMDLQSGIYFAKPEDAFHFKLRWA